MCLLLGKVYPRWRYGRRASIRVTVLKMTVETGSPWYTSIRNGISHVDKPIVVISALRLV